MIKQYFWFILGLDVVCMLYIYKTIYDKQQDAGLGSQSILGKLTEFIDNLVDTSLYKDQIEIQPSSAMSGESHPVPITTTPHTISHGLHQSLGQPQSILKTPPAQNPGRKSVEFDETRDEVREYDPVSTEPELPPDNDTLLNMITNPASNITKPTAQHSGANNNELATPIRQIRAQQPSTANQPAVQPPHLEQATPLTQIRAQAQQQQQPPGTIPPPVSAKLLQPVATKVKPGDGAIQDIKYDPTEFLRDIQYETRLPSEQTIQPPASPLTKANLGGFDGFGSGPGAGMLTNGGSGDDDRYSTVSKVSDLGSMLDFDMKEFENSI